MAHSPRGLVAAHAADSEVPLQRAWGTWVVESPTGALKSTTGSVHFTRRRSQLRHGAGRRLHEESTPVVSEAHQGRDPRLRAL
jgi:hypothetical protein